MPPVTLRHVAALLLLTGAALLPRSAVAQGGSARFKVHDFERPRPRVVTPGRDSGAPPSDAIVLFDGRALDEWRTDSGAPARWVLRDGYMQTVPGAGAVTSVRPFGDMQLHIEWATPSPAVGSGQDRGNSGVIIMGRYEVQVLDSYENTTYADGQAASLYGQHPPLVNASRPPGEWQSYDIVFRRPRWSNSGKLLSPARMTVLHNGVLVQDNATLWGETNWLHYNRYSRHADALPITLQDHDHPVRYRNIWVRPLPDLPTNEDAPARSRPVVSLTAPQIARLTGAYASADRLVATVRRRGISLVLELPGRAEPLELVAQSPTRFVMAETAGTVDFTLSSGAPTRLVMKVAGALREGIRRP